MREWHDITAAFTGLCADGLPSALATVVRVDGSAYRRPGARMLIAEDGRTWGGVSGGCLERDVAARARGVIAAGRPFLQRYDTADEELVQRGVSTGCGGTIDVLIQPLSADAPGVVPVLAGVLRSRRSALIATVIQADAAATSEIGRTFEECVTLPTSTNDATARAVDSSNVAGTYRLDRATFLLSTLIGPRHSHAHADLKSADGSNVTLFIERLTPPPRLVIVGGGPDAVPLVTIAKTLGWHVAVVAAMPALNAAGRFAAADELHVTPADAPLHGVAVSTDDAVVVMTHNLARDALALAGLAVRPKYLGLLGPKHRTARVTAALPSGHPACALHSPVGLDLGGDSPEEIALSIVAQIQTCLRRGSRAPCPAADACTT